MKKIRVLYLIDKLTAAGSQTNLVEIVRRLDRSRFEPKVITLTGGGELVAELQAIGVHLVQLGVRKAYGLSGLKALFFLIRFMKKERIDVVETHFLHADLLGTVAAKLAGVKRIVTTRRDEGFWRSKRQLSLNRFLNYFADKILANSFAVKEAVEQNEKVDSRKIRIIHNGVDLSRYCSSNELRDATRKELGIQDDELLVGTVANMRYEIKGHRFLIQAIPSIKDKMPNVKFLFVGDGPLKERFQNYASRLHVLDQIVFLGARRDITALVNAMDIVCAPSLSEGFSNTILESMAVGKPVVATNVGGNPEIVLDDETGFLVRPQNVKAIEEGLLLLLTREETRLKMGKAAHKRVRAHFSVEKMVKEYEAFYESIMGFLPLAEGELLYRPHKIMYLIWSLDLGGAEQVVVDLVKKLDRQNFEPLVCCLNEKGRSASQVEKLGVKVIALHKKPKIDLFIIPKLVCLMKMEKVDLIHTHLFTANLWGRIAAKLAGVPVVSSEHGMDLWRKRIHLTFDSLLTRTNKRIIFVSEGVKRFYMSRNHSLNGKSRVIHNGIDVASFQGCFDRSEIRKGLGIKPTDKVIGIVGRLVPEKAHVEFIETIQLLLEERRNIVGLIVGEGELLGRLRERVQECQLEKHICFAGFRNDLPKLYQAMDVFVLCSLHEGLPLTILEAMAAGVPIVTTDVGGIKECIQDGRDGFLVPPGDSLALASAISKILNDEHLKKTLVASARKRVQSYFSVEKMVKEHEALYSEVLES